eukprot:m.201305 g.201305  ORF g.201305 m.201305 type:complete len:657 (+) comp17057_c0_seq4:152-2122(+)
MLLEDGTVRVTNFSAGIDQLWQLPTSIRFHSPQLCKGEAPSATDDVYAFGVLMLELASGRRIFQGLDESSIQERTFASDLPYLPSAAGLHAASSAALAFDPKQRPPYHQLLALLPGAHAEPVTIVDNLHVLERRSKRLATGLIQAQVVTPHHRLKQQALMAVYADQTVSADLWALWQSSAHKMPRLHHPRLLPVLATASLGQPHPSQALVAADVPCILDMQQTLSTWQARKCVTIDVLSALEYLLARRFVPTNLSLANVYLDNGNAKLFGLVLSSDEGSLEAVTGIYTRFLQDAFQCLSVLHMDEPLRQLLTMAMHPQPQSEVGKSATALSLLALQASDIANGNAKWHLPWSALSMVKFLGEGSFGRVSLMTVGNDYTSPNLRLVASQTKDPLQYVAVKELLDDNCEAEFRQELSIMTKIRHPHLVTLLHHVDEPGHQALVLEYLDGGSLDDWLESPLGMSASEPVMFGVVQSIAAGMAELARLKIVHRDLAARNVLVSNDASIVKVSDYGLSRSMTINVNDDSAYYRVETSRPLPLRWIAVEALISKKFTEATDVYAFGVTIGEIFDGARLPLEELDDTAIITLLTSSLRKMQHGTAVAPLYPVPPRCPPLLGSLMQQCVAMSADERPSFNTILDLLKQDASIVDWTADESESRL